MAPINGFHFCDHAKNTFAILASGELRLWACVVAKNVHFVDVERARIRRRAAEWSYWRKSLVDLAPRLFNGAERASSE